MSHIKEILTEYQDTVIEKIQADFEEISAIEIIRINLSAVFNCRFENTKCILKYLIVELPEEHENADTWNSYNVIHANKMIKLAEVNVFPEIYSTKKYEINEYVFLVIIEEFLPYNFSEGIIENYKRNNLNIIKTASQFLYELLSSYKEAYRKAEFISHRDLSFDNLMFDRDYNLKMIDLGSAKSESTETTMFALPAPTKRFYAAPEYDYIHINNKTKGDLIKAEIYTIGLLVLSMLNSLQEELFRKNTTQTCGIINWLNKQQKTQLMNHHLEEKHKQDYLSFILIEIFIGDDKHVLFRLLKSMTESSVSARIKDYDIIIKHLERMDIHE